MGTDKRFFSMLIIYLVLKPLRRFVILVPFFWEGKDAAIGVVGQYPVTVFTNMGLACPLLSGPDRCSDGAWKESDMGRKRHSPEEIIGKLREAEVLIARGQTTPQAAKAIGVTEQTYYRWRREYGGMKVDQAKRLKALERENQRLRKAVSDLTLDKMILEEVGRGKF